jgi:hypothetical protein
MPSCAPPATLESNPAQAGSQDHATGFIRLNALRLKIATRAQGKKQPAKPDMEFLLKTYKKYAVGWFADIFESN